MFKGSGQRKIWQGYMRGRTKRGSVFLVFQTRPCLFYYLDELYKIKNWFIPAVFLMILLFACVFAHADTINVNKLADAIYKAENSKTHPYGILTHYEHTTPRQACVNTINHALRDWDGKGNFIEFLGSRYCPIGAKNDPTGLNKYWVKNVRFFYVGLK